MCSSCAAAPLPLGRRGRRLDSHLAGGSLQQLLWLPPAAETRTLSKPKSSQVPPATPSAGDAAAKKGAKVAWRSVNARLRHFLNGPNQTWRGFTSGGDQGSTAGADCDVKQRFQWTPRALSQQRQPPPQQREKKKKTARLRLKRNKGLEAARRRRPTSVASER